MEGLALNSASSMNCSAASFMVLEWNTAAAAAAVVTMVMKKKPGRVIEGV
jgi:hypothetical protein